MKNPRMMWCATAAIVALLGCGDGEHGAGGGDHAGGHDAGEATSSSTTGAGGQDALAAPVLDEVTPMHGALHLYWTNTTGDCDEVEGERMVGGAAYEVFFNVPGTVDNEADDAATDPDTVYTYRVRCLRAGEYSAYSNELGGSPE